MKEKKYDKFLPLGSIVLLKGATKRLMITGFCVTPNDNKNVIYDYSGCLYPEGIILTDQVALFNHDQIDKIYMIGYSDEEEKEFKTKLVSALNDNQRINNG